MNAPINRREFLVRAGKAGAAIAAAGGAGLLFHDRHGPSHSNATTGLVTLKDFSVPALRGKMSIAQGADRRKTLAKALETFGGIGGFIKEGDRVFIKVNAAFATPAALGATTHPELVSEVTRLCLQAGAVEVIVADNPINDPQSCFRLSGIAEAAQLAGATLLLPTPGAFRPTTLAGGNLIKNWPLLHRPFEGANKLIGLAPIKDHHRSGASMSMKNWYGLLGGRRNIFHQDINSIIKELALMVRPTFVVLDGTQVMMTNGPTGGSLDDLKATNTLVVSTDQVAADAFGATLLGKTAAELPFIGLAAAAGAGTADFNSLNPNRADA